MSKTIDLKKNIELLILKVSIALKNDCDLTMGQHAIGDLRGHLHVVNEDHPNVLDPDDDSCVQALMASFLKSIVDEWGLS